MNLYLNTSGKLCEVALLKSESVIDHMVHSEAMKHSTVLHDMIANLLKNNDVNFSDLKSVAVLNGPGSYTGLRVGLAAAKGICYATQLPLILFNQLSLCNTLYLKNQKTDAAVASIVPARAGEYFFEMRQNDKILYEASVYEQEKIINILTTEIPNHILLCPDIERIEEIPLKAEKIELRLKNISKEIDNRLKINQLESLFFSEPFYLKKVHINTPKKRFS